MQRWIPGFYGKYAVDETGNVYSYTARKKGEMLSQFWTGRPPTKHLSVDLGNKCLTVHRLVMLAFVGECPEGKEVCHNDGDRTNNSLSNLRYDTRKANIEDQFRHGRKHKTTNQHLRAIPVIADQLLIGAYDNQKKWSYRAT